MNFKFDRFRSDLNQSNRRTKNQNERNTTAPIRRLRMIRVARQIRRLPTRALEGLRCLSEAPSSSPEFEYPKAKALFEKITAKLDTADEVRQFQEELMRSLGREPLDRYFYFDGFGGKGGRKKGSGEASSASAEPAAPAAVDVKLVGFDAKAKIKVIKGTDKACCWNALEPSSYALPSQRSGRCWVWV